MRVTKADVLEALHQLLEVYVQPKRWSTLADVADRWVEILGDLQREELTAGVRDQLRTADEHMPLPGKIRKHALEHRTGRSARTGLAARYDSWEASGWQDGGGYGTPCPVCGAPPEWRPRYLVVHNLASHLRQGIPLIGEHDGRMPPYQAIAPVAA